MASYKRFEDLPIWQEARDYSRKVFWASKEGEFSFARFRNERNKIQISR